MGRLTLRESRIRLCADVSRPNIYTRFPLAQHSEKNESVSRSDLPRVWPTLFLLVNSGARGFPEIMPRPSESLDRFPTVRGVARPDVGDKRWAIVSNPHSISDRRCRHADRFDLTDDEPMGDTCQLGSTHRTDSNHGNAPAERPGGHRSSVGAAAQRHARLPHRRLGGLKGLRERPATTCAAPSPFHTHTPITLAQWCASKRAIGDRH